MFESAPWHKRLPNSAGPLQQAPASSYSAVLSAGIRPTVSITTSTPQQPSTLHRPIKTAVSAQQDDQQLPPSLKAYVDKCFSKCISSEEKDRVESVLKAKIQSAIDSNTLLSTDWDSMEAVLVATPVLSDSGDMRAIRAKRFEEPQKKPKKKANVLAVQAQTAEVINWDQYTIVGTSQQLEKRYLRLTSVRKPLYCL